MKKDHHNWTFEGEQYCTGESVTEVLKTPYKLTELDDIFSIVWFEKKLYRCCIKHSFGKTKVCLFSIYNDSKNGYWVNAKRVFQVIKKTNNGIKN
jgi:hypothetical protein